MIRWTPIIFILSVLLLVACTSEQDSNSQAQTANSLQQRAKRAIDYFNKGDYKNSYEFFSPEVRKRCTSADYSRSSEIAVPQMRQFAGAKSGDRVEVRLSRVEVRGDEARVFGEIILNGRTVPDPENAGGRWIYRDGTWWSEPEALLAGCSLAGSNEGSGQIGSTPIFDRPEDALETTALVVGQDQSGTFAGPSDQNILAWLADAPGAYRITVTPEGGGSVEIILSKQGRDGHINEITKDKSSKLVDITHIASYPAVYFIQLRQAGKGKVENYTLRVDRAEDPYLRPQIIAMPATGNTGDTFTAFGSGFGPRPGNLQFGRSASAGIIMWSPSQIIGTVPQGNGIVDVVVKTKGGKTSEPFRFTYGSQLGNDTIQIMTDWAKRRIPDAEKRLKEAADRMWEAYADAEKAYSLLKETRGAKVFQEIDDAIEAASLEASSEATSHLLAVLQKQAQQRGERGASVFLPFVARYALTALNYFEIGKWATMDVVLVAKNLRSQWYTWAVLRPAVGELERAEIELASLRLLAQSEGPRMIPSTRAPTAISWRLVGQLGPRIAKVVTIAVSPAFATDHTLYVGTHRGTRGEYDYQFKDGVFVSADGGITWQASSNGLTDTGIVSLAVSPNFPIDGTLLVGTDSGSIFRSTDGGGTWQRASFDLYRNDRVEFLTFSPAFATDHTVYAAVSSSSGLLRSTDGGRSWEKLISEHAILVALSPDFAIDHTLFVVVTGDETGDSFKVFRSIDGGDTWRRSDDGLPSIIADLVLSPAFATDQTLWAAVFGEGLFKSTNGGASWKMVGTEPKGEGRDKGLTQTFQSLAVSPGFATDHTLFTIAANEVFRSADEGKTWQSTTSGELIEDPVQCLAFSPGFSTDQTLFAGGYYGLYRRIGQ